MTDIASILIVEDDHETQKSYYTILQRSGYRLCAAADGVEALERLDRAPDPVDVVLTDLKMPRMDGLGLLAALRERQYHGHVIMVTGFATIDTAVEATKLGAYSYLVKPVTAQALVHLLDRALDEQRLQRENALLRRELARDYRTRDLLGSSRAMQELRLLIEKAARADSTVLIQGESGTGKEMVARALHAHSDRQSRLFTAINCAGIADTLLESELFGHERGAFTGAIRPHPGMLRAADGGTVLLDEVGDTPPSVQVKLLRVLEEKLVRPVGGTASQAIDVRFLAATNADLRQQIKDGKFRQDLYYRLNVVAISLPPLRERREDIPILVNHFLRYESGRLKKAIDAVAPDAMVQLMTYPWPGNVRELKHAVARAVTLSRGPVLTVSDLPPAVSGLPEDTPAPQHTFPTLGESERSLIVAALHRTGGHQTQAAALLGISRVTLWRKLKEHQIEIR